MLAPPEVHWIRHRSSRIQVGETAHPPTLVGAITLDANELYDYFCECVRSTGVPVSKGFFQADLQVTLSNDGPVTLIIEKSA